jgi:hypothetical protein
MLDYITQDNLTNDKDNDTVMETFMNSESLGAIRTPVVHDGDKWVLNKRHRFFYDDVFYGLCVAKWFAQKLGVAVECIDDVLGWAQDYLNEKIIEDGKLIIYPYLNERPLKYGVPESYGLQTLDEVMD